MNSDYGKIYQILSLDYAAAEEEEEDSGSFSMISRNDDAIYIVKFFNIKKWLCYIYVTI